MNSIWRIRILFLGLLSVTAVGHASPVTTDPGQNVVLTVVPLGGPTMETGPNTWKTVEVFITATSQSVLLSRIQAVLDCYLPRKDGECGGYITSTGTDPWHESASDPASGSIPWVFAPQGTCVGGGTPGAFCMNDGHCSGGACDTSNHDNAGFGHPFAGGCDLVAYPGVGETAYLLPAGETRYVATSRYYAYYDCTVGEFNLNFRDASVPALPTDLTFVKDETLDVIRITTVGAQLLPAGRNCCATSQDCEDADPCTANYCCNGMCLFNELECCASASECNDFDFCTSDTCENGFCVHSPVSGCATDLTLSLVPVGGTTVQGGQVVVLEAFLTNEATVDEQIGAVQVDLPCSLSGVSGSTGVVNITSSGLSVGNTSDPSSGSVPWLFAAVPPNDPVTGCGGAGCYGGMKPIAQAACRLAGASGAGEPPYILPAGETRYIGTWKYRVSDCATGSFDALFEGVSQPPSSSDLTRVIGATANLLPFARVEPRLTVQLGTCCDGQTCLADGINGQCCLITHTGASWYAGRSCGESTPCAPGGPSMGQCMTDAECDDEVLCTMDTCESGACFNVPMVDCPAASPWGVAVLALLIFTGGSGVIARRVRRA